MSLAKFIKRSWADGTQIGKPNILAATYLGGSAHFFLYFLYKYFFHLHENIYLRAITVFLCISVSSYYHLPSKIKEKYFPFYWHAMLITALPLVLTYNLFCTNFHEAWLYWEIFMIFLLIVYVPNILIFFVDLLIGVSGAYLLFRLTMPDFNLDPEFDVFAFAIVAVFTASAGIIFIYGNKIVWFNRQREQHSTLVALAGSIVHELRNPLNAIKLSITNISDFIPNKSDGAVILNKEDVVAISRYKTIANNSIKTANNIIDISLDNLKGKEINKKLFTPLSATEIIRKAIEEYGYKDDSEKSKIIIDLEEDFTFKGDATLAVYILFNLIKNALYYLSSFPSSTIAIRTKTGKDYNRIYVHDTGPGIPKDRLENLFKDFNTVGKIGGTGLGLSFCKRTMLSFNGDIKCYSELGKYTEFVLEFPIIIRGEGENQEIDAQSLIDQSKPVFAHNVLLVDDQQVNLSIVKSLVERDLESISCDIATNGLDAVHKVKENNYDVVLMDIQMPEMDGITAVKKIREFNSTVPIIAYSSRNSQLAIKQAKSVGFNGYVIKPIIHEIVLKTISKWGFIEYKKSANDGEILKNLSLKEKKILFADDQDVNRMLSANYLKKYGAIVEEAVNGQEALEKAKTNDYDLILMDVQMPIMDGVTATKEIIKFRKENKMKYIPTIVVTGDGEKDQIRRLLTTGFDDYFIKGQSQSKLLKSIDFLLKFNLDDSAETRLIQASSVSTPTNDSEKEIKTNTEANLTFDLDHDLLIQIKPIFLKEAYDRISDIKKSKSKNNIGDFLLISHALKGICGNIGAKDLFEYSTKINNLAKDGKWPQEADWIEKLDDLYKKIKEALDSI